ncbi:unnamed protein product, partial [Acidithrix sp. C25]
VLLRLLNSERNLNSDNLPTLQQLLEGDLPEAGVHFLFEDSELRRCGDILRVVNIGSHRVSDGSKAKLKDRLRTHAGPKTLKGSHRSSILRQYIGDAIGGQDPKKWELAMTTWGRGGKVPSKDVRNHEMDLEEEVSRVINEMRILVLPVHDRATRESDRAFIVQNAVALLGWDPYDRPSGSWLGNFSSNKQIASNGLWNIAHLHEPVSSQFIRVIDGLVNVNQSGGPMPTFSLAPSNWKGSRYID